MLMLDEFITQDIADIVISDFPGDGVVGNAIRVRQEGKLQPYPLAGTFDLEQELKLLAKKSGVNPGRNLPQTGEYVQKGHKIEVSFVPTLAGGSWAIHINHTDRSIPTLAELKVPLKTRAAIWQALEDNRGLILAEPTILYSVASQLEGDLMTIEDRARFILDGADQYVIKTGWASLAPQALKVAIKRQPSQLFITRLDSKTLAESACDYAMTHLVLASVPTRVIEPVEYLGKLGVPDFLLKHVIKVNAYAASTL